MAQTPCPASPNTRAPGKPGAASGQEAMPMPSFPHPLAPNSTVQGNPSKIGHGGRNAPPPEGTFPQVSDPSLSREPPLGQFCYFS